MHRIRRHITILLFLICCDIAIAQIQTTPSTASCVCDGSITFNNPLPGNATYTLLDNNGIAQEITTNNTGIFNFGGLCSSVFTLEVDQNGTSEVYVFNIPANNVNPGNAAEIAICSTNGNSNLSGYIPGLTTGGVWTDPDGNVHNGIFNPANDNAGLYTYTIQNGGCDVSTGVLISLIQNADPGDYVNYLICEDYVPFLMTDWMDDPNGEWFDEFGNPVSGWFDPATMNTATFVYMIDTVVGCPPVFASMTVTENMIPDAGTDATVLVCSNGVPFTMTDYLGGTPAPGGQWYDAFNNQVSAVFDPSTMDEGIYRYKVDGQAPCDDVNSYLTIEFTDTNPSGESATVNLCSNGAALNMFNQLNGNPIAGGTWTNASNQIVDGIFNPANEPAGVYSYYFPNVGCSPGNSTLTITVEQLLNAGLNNTITFCENTNSFNLNTYLSAGTSTNGIWTNDNNEVIGSIVTINGPSNEVYTYSVNGTYCPDDQSTISVLVEAETPTPGNVQLTLCSESEPIDLNDLYTTDGLLFENFQGNAVGNIFDPAASTSQTITVIAPSTNSCPDASSTIAITVEVPAFENDTVQVDVCNSIGTYDLNASNDAIDFSNGNWYNSFDVLINPEISLVGEMSAAYYFESSPQAVCASSVFRVELNSFEPNDAGPDDEVVFCTSDDAVLLTNLLPIATGGLGQWTFDDEIFNDDEIDPETDTPGTYAYVIPANGPCPADVAYLDVIIQNGIAYEAGPDVMICHGDGPVTIGQDNPAGCTFEWTPAQNLSTPSGYVTEVSVENTLAVPVTFEYEVEVSDGVCTVVDTVSVTVNPLPNPQLATAYNLCAGDDLELNTGVTGTFDWEPASLFDDPQLAVQIISPIDTVNVSVGVENQWGCEGQASTSVIVHPMPYPIFTDEPVAGCPPLSWTFELVSSSTNCDQILWDFGTLGIFEGQSINSVTMESGLYEGNLSVSSAFGCSTTLPLGVLIEVYPTPMADFEWDPLMVTTLDPVVTFSDLSQDALIYHWDFAGLDTSAIPEPTFEFPSTTPGNYEVCLTVYNEYTCADTQCEIIHLENEYIFYAPNTFTPDNDGINDVFAPVVLGFDNTTYELQIFNRWGEMIFETNLVNQPWTGNVNGGAHYAEDGTYAWQVRIKDKENAEYRIFRGHLNLLR